MNTISIEKNIDIPKRGGGRGAVYPWAELQAGDSFFAPCQSAALLQSAKGWAARNAPTWKFIVRKEVGGARIWRVE